MKHGFTLIELIVVIIIVGILAALGLTQYSTIIEKSRTAEAKIRIGAMRQLAHEYYLNNGTMTGITNADVGVDNTSCSSTSFYSYFIGATSTYVTLYARRCLNGGKTPNASFAWWYDYYLRYYPATGQCTWYCWLLYTGGACFGLPPY